MEQARAICPTMYVLSCVTLGGVSYAASESSEGAVSISFLAQQKAERSGKLSAAEKGGFRESHLLCLGIGNYAAREGD